MQVLCGSSPLKELRSGLLILLSQIKPCLPADTCRYIMYGTVAERVTCTDVFSLEVSVRHTLEQYQCGVLWYSCGAVHLTSVQLQSNIWHTLVLVQV